MPSDAQKSTAELVPSPDARFPSAADTYGRRKRDREERAMGVMDLEVQRERRVELLREAESRRAGRRGRPGDRAHALSKVVSFWVIGR